MTRQEFIGGYCARGGVSWDWLSIRRDAIPCDCGDAMCSGWQMVPKDEVADSLIEQAKQEAAE